MTQKSAEDRQNHGVAPECTENPSADSLTNIPTPGYHLSATRRVEAMHDAPVTGARRLTPVLPPVARASAIASFMLGGFVVSVADGLIR